MFNWDDEDEDAPEPQTLTEHWHRFWGRVRRTGGKVATLFPAEEPLLLASLLLADLEKALGGKAPHLRNQIARANYLVKRRLTAAYCISELMASGNLTVDGPPRRSLRPTP